MVPGVRAKSTLYRCRVFCFVLHFGFQGLKAIFLLWAIKSCLTGYYITMPIFVWISGISFSHITLFLYGNSYLSFVSARLDYGIFMRWYIIMSPVYLILV